MSNVNKQLLYEQITCIHILLTGKIPTKKYVVFLEKNGDLRKITESILASCTSNNQLLKINWSSHETRNNLDDKSLTNILEITKRKINIYQTIRDFSILKKTSEMYRRMCEWREMNIVNYHPYNNEECSNMIRKNFPSDVYLAYQKLIPGAFKSDLWRLCALYLNGGLYIDSHIKRIHPDIGSLLKVPDYVFCIDYPCSPNYIYNAFMMAPRRSSLIKELIREIVKNVKHEYYPLRDLEITGPGLHGQVIKKFLKLTYFEEGFQQIGNEIYLFLSHRVAKSSIPIKDLKHRKFSINLHNNIICTCRYETYREELTSICKQVHYSEHFKRRQVYDQNIKL